MSRDVCHDDSEAYRLFGTPDELMLEAMADNLKLQLWAHEDPDMPEEYRQWSLGLAAWEVIGFALERGWAIPEEALYYLQQVASDIEDWSALNGHPGELKSMLMLQGQRKTVDQKNDPRWVYGFISQMKANEPRRSIKSLTREFLKRHPKLTYSEDAIRQKYYEGKRLAETGHDYKGRGRKKELRSASGISIADASTEIEF